MDIWSKKKRSNVMSKIRSKNTKPERTLRSMLHKSGYRFRIHRKDLPGNPDIVLQKFKAIIFVNGCFWHYHKNCPEGRIPNTNSKFWNDKLIKNIERDKNNIKKLKKMGWKVIVVWECEIEKKIDIILKKIINYLKLK